MNQILIGITITALALAGFQTWRASVAAENATRWGESVSQLTAALENQSEAFEGQEQRMRDFDDSLVRLEDQQRQSGRDLIERLGELQNFLPQPGDSDETIRCARLPVPVDVDRQLRK